MNKLLILALFSACLFVITQASEQVKEKRVAEFNANIAPLREVREADAKRKDVNKKKRRKGKNSKKLKNSKKSKSKKKNRKTKKMKKSKTSGKGGQGKKNN